LRKLEIAAQIVTGDAGTYRFPEGPIVVFLYNPFGVPTIQKVIEHLPEQSESYLIYVNPQHQAVFSGFRKLHSDRVVTVLARGGDLTA